MATKTRRKFDRKTAQKEALNRATTNASLANYPAIYEGFLARGLAFDDIRPRENVLSYNAFQAVGRQVRKGEKGVKIVTWIEGEKEDKKTGKSEKFKFSRTVSVFHISQTDPIGGAVESAPVIAGYLTYAA
jgi:antirestriction protein ArdC